MGYLGHLRFERATPALSDMQRRERRERISPLILPAQAEDFIFLRKPLVNWKIIIPRISRDTRRCAKRLAYLSRPYKRKLLPRQAVKAANASSVWRCRSLIRGSQHTRAQ